MKRMKTHNARRDRFGNWPVLQVLLAICCISLVAAVAAAAASSQPTQVETIEQAKQAVAADPSSERAQVALGNLLLAQGDLDAAAKAFEAALELNPRFHDALTGKGIVLARMGKGQEAEKVLQQALVLNPNPVRTHYELGRLYENRGDLAAAIAEYKKGMEKYEQGKN